MLILGYAYRFLSNFVFLALVYLALNFLEKYQNRVIVAVPECTRHTGDGSATVGRRDHVEPHERAIVGPIVGDGHVLGHHGVASRAALVEDPHRVTLTASC